MNFTPNKFNSIQLVMGKKKRPAFRRSFRKKRPVFGREKNSADRTGDNSNNAVRDAIVLTAAKKKLPRQAPVPANELKDRLRVWEWRDEGLDINVARARCCKNPRTAKRWKLTCKRSYTWFEKWWDYNPQADYADGRQPFGDVRGGGNKKFTEEFKDNQCRQFLAENHDPKKLTSVRAYCREQNKDGRVVDRSSLGRWLRERQAPIKPYQLASVPSELTILHEAMRLQYAEANVDRDWECVSFSDEAYFDTGEIANLLKRRVFYYATAEDSWQVPTVWRTKWSGVKVPFSVVVDPTGYREIITWEKSDWVPPPEDAEQLIDPTTLTHEDLDELDHVAGALDNDYKFTKRGWKKKYRKRKSGKRSGNKPVENVNAENFCKLVAPHIHTWWQWK